MFPQVSLTKPQFAPTSPHVFGVQGAPLLELLTLDDEELAPEDDDTDDELATEDDELATDDDELATVTLPLLEDEDVPEPPCPPPLDEPTVNEPPPEPEPELVPAASVTKCGVVEHAPTTTLHESATQRGGLLIAPSRPHSPGVGKRASKKETTHRFHADQRTTPVRCEHRRGCTRARIGGRDDEASCSWCRRGWAHAPRGGVR